MKARLILEGWGERLVEVDGGVSVKWSGLYLADGTIVDFIFEPEWIYRGSAPPMMRASDLKHPAGPNVPMWLTDVEVVRPKGWKKERKHK